MNFRFVEKIGGPAIIITDKVLSVMHKYRQLHPSAKEAGGQLYAKFEGVDTLILEATKPKFLDKRTRYRFRPNRTLQRFEIYCRYKKGLHFVGDWHTHPEKYPSPSNKDINYMYNNFHLSLIKFRAFVMVIIGTEPEPEGLHVALVRSKSIIQLQHEA
ncbi:MAG: Mov34/MPN/PAD-1 family protein [Smithella sp.]